MRPAACSSVKPSSLSLWTNMRVSKCWPSRARGGVVWKGLGESWLERDDVREESGDAARAREGRRCDRDDVRSGVIVCGKAAILGIEAAMSRYLAAMSLSGIADDGCFWEVLFRLILFLPEAEIYGTPLFNYPRDLSRK